MYYVTVIQHVIHAFESDRNVVLTSALGAFLSTLAYWWSSAGPPERHNYSPSMIARVRWFVLFYKTCTYLSHVAMVVSTSVLVSYLHSSFKGSNVIHMAWFFAHEHRRTLIQGCQLDEELMKSEPCQKIVESFSQYQLPMLIDTLSASLCGFVLYMTVHNGTSLLETASLAVMQHHQRVALRNSTVTRAGTMRFAFVAPVSSSSSRVISGSDRMHLAEPRLEYLSHGLEGESNTSIGDDFDAISGISGAVAD